MTNQQESLTTNHQLKNVIDITIKLGVLVLLYVWCFNIIKPFISLVVWAAIIAVSVYPLYRLMLDKFGGRQNLTGIVFTLLMFILLLTPITMLSGSLIDGIKLLTQTLEHETLTVPAPSQNIREWPLIGEKVYSLWHLAFVNMGEVIVKFTPQIKAVGKELFSILLGSGMGMLQFFISIFIAGVFLVNADTSFVAVNRFVNKLSPAKGAGFVKTASATIRSVAQGVIGVGIVQAAVVGIGFWAIDLPGAGLWALLVMILSIAQLTPFLVVLPVIVYVFVATDTSTLVTIVFTIWSVFGGLLDNILKPFVMGRGVDAPMLVIMLGAIGGMIYSGILGLFTGAIVLALGYILYQSWLDDPKDSTLIENKKTEL